MGDFVKTKHAIAQHNKQTQILVWLFTGPRRTVPMLVITYHMKWKNSCTRPFPNHLLSLLTLSLLLFHSEWMSSIYLMYPCSLYSPLVYVSFGIFTFHFLLSLIRRRYSAPHFIRSTKHFYLFTFLNLISARFQFRSIHFLKVFKQTGGSWLPSRDEATFFCASYFLPVVRFRSAFFFITFGSVRFLLFVYTHFLFSFSFITFDII